MATLVCMGASLQCSFGLAPSTLVVLPVKGIMAGTPAANITDSAPFVNVPPFGMCTSIANPAVAAATAAALGVLTPMPCIPTVVTPWVPGSPKVMVRNLPAVDLTCKATCAFGGLIQILTPGQFKVQLS